MVGCGGFLSFSLVFCGLGGRLGPTLYIHFIRRWVEARRHSSAPRESEGEKKAERCAILRSAERRAWGACVEFINRPVQLTASASPGPAPSRVAYTAFSPLRLCAWRRLRPPLRLSWRAYARRETEKPNAPVAAQVCGCRLRQPVHEGCPACCRRFISLEMAVAPPAA